jgi:alkanesulfonate monooxygenase SsuD/methylene tetrahydromethanopterin reductase-like flavin-dependent oxidoreductase (luciferase family)
MYTRDEPSFSGKYYSIVNAECSPKPIQKPYPPIMVGGTGEKHLLKIVAKYADIYNHPFAPPLEVQRGLNVLKDHRKSTGRIYEDIERSVVFRCLIRESEEEINDLILKEKNGDESFEHFVQKINAVTGTPELIKKRINEYIDVGITRFIIHFVSLDSRSLRLMDSKVIRKL